MNYGKDLKKPKSRMAKSRREPKVVTKPVVVVNEELPEPMEKVEEPTHYKFIGKWSGLDRLVCDYCGTELIGKASMERHLKLEHFKETLMHMVQVESPILGAQGKPIVKTILEPITEE